MNFDTKICSMNLIWKKKIKIWLLNTVEHNCRIFLETKIIILWYDIWEFNLELNLKKSNLLL